jgi:GntR family transcriptional repressor for pyruvate dehydrogenase complex
MRRATPEDLATSRTAVRIASTLRREIVLGRLRPGDQLKPERELCDQFEVSRPTLREAIRMLEAQSLIEMRRGFQGGPVVRSLSVSTVSKQIGVALQIERTSLADLWRARSVLEPAAAAEMARSANRDGVAALAANIEDSRAAMDNPTLYARRTSEFTEILAEHCGNKTLRLLVRLLSDIVWATDKRLAAETRPSRSVLRVLNLSIAARERLLGRIERGEAEEAEQSWRAHLVAMGEMVLGVYGASTTVDVLSDPDLEARRLRGRAPKPDRP